MCGIVGIFSQSSVSQDLYDALTIIQHRGQDAAGIITYGENRVFLRKSNGLVRDAIQERHILRLRGHMGLGHVRYPTAGTQNASESQPFYVNSPYGLSLVHNGNLINAEHLANKLRCSDFRHLNTQSDSEVLLNAFAFELSKLLKKRLERETLFRALQSVYSRLVGAYSAILMINGYGLLAFRDPFGIRPLIYGQRKTASGKHYMVVSESIALDVLGYERVGDIKPGEAIFIGNDQQVYHFQYADQASHRPCIFEYIYLARPDSRIDGISVYQSRLAMGTTLAKRILKEHPDHDIQAVIPIPDTSCASAIAVAEQLGVTYCEGFVKNRYIGRTFIMPGQAMRRSKVRMKLNPIREEFYGKNILLIDDSIVRGTTSREIIQMSRDAGAKKVYFASAAPKIIYPNVYGIDIPVASELIGHHRTTKEISNQIGADWLVYQDLKDVCRAINSVAKCNEYYIERFEDSIFTGDYVTGGVSAAYLQRIAALRNESVRQTKWMPGDEESINNVEIT